MRKAIKSTPKSPKPKQLQKTTPKKKHKSKKRERKKIYRNINITGFLKKYILPCLPYVAMGWFANKTSEAYNLSQDNRTAFRILETLPNLSTTISNPLPSFVLTDLIIGLIGGILFYAIVWVRKKNAKKWRHDVEYGSARWSA